jgi:hypothetical protein
MINLWAAASNQGLIVCCSSLVSFFWFWTDVSIISPLHCDAQTANIIATLLSASPMQEFRFVFCKSCGSRRQGF